MKPGEVERWVISVVDHLERGLRVEDDRVECKRQLIDHSKAARRLAGHANQAREDRILWVIGVDEDAASPVCGLSPGGPDPADWWSQVEAKFQDVAPAITWVNVPIDSDRTVLGLGFDTSRLPYVIKVPSGEVSREIPWREGTRTRSANRVDLLKLLVPVAQRPEVSILDGLLEVTQEQSRDKRTGQPTGEVDHLAWNGRLNVYVDCVAPLVFPDHRCRGSASFESGDTVDLTTWPGASNPNARSATFVTPPSLLLAEQGFEQVVVQGPSRMWISMRATTSPERRYHVASAGRLDIELRTGGLDSVTTKLTAALVPVAPEKLPPNRILQWVIWSPETA